MIVAIDVCNGRIFFDYCKIVFIIVEVARQWIVAKAHESLAWSNSFAKSLVEPKQIFLFYVAIAHLHKWSAIHSSHHQIIDFKHETVLSPNVAESFASALTPSVLVVAWQHICGFGKFIERAFHISKFTVATLIAQVSVHHHSIHITRIDFSHG